MSSKVFEEVELQAKVLSNYWHDFYSEISQHLPESYQPEMQELSAKLGEALENLIGELHNPTLTLATTGTTSSGKSTLVNLLCGAEIVPVAVSEMSAGVVTIEYSEEKSLMIHETPGAEWECGEWRGIHEDEICQRLYNVMISYIDNRKKHTDLACPQSVIRFPFRLLKESNLQLPRGTRVRIMDLPGLAYVGDEGNASVIRQCREALCIVAYNSQETDEQKVRNLLQEVVEQVKDLGGSPARMLFVLNKIDVFRGDRNWPDSENRFVDKTIKSIKTELFERLKEYTEDIEKLQVLKLSAWSALLSLQIQSTDEDFSTKACKLADKCFNELIAIDILEDLPRKVQNWSRHDRSRVAKDLWQKSYAEEFQRHLINHIDEYFPQLVIPPMIERFNTMGANAIAEWTTQTTTAILNRSEKQYLKECEDIKSLLDRFLMTGTAQLRETFERIPKVKQFDSEKTKEDPTFISHDIRKREIIDLSYGFPSIERLAVRIRSQSKIIDQGSPVIYKLPLVEDMRDTDKMISRCHIGQPSFPPAPEKVLMVVGATGAGKSTLINGMVNYILGVDWKDNFRFKMIIDESGKSQAHSQTKLITAYTIHQMEGSPLPYTLTIIDTPGFGDTEGLKRDKFITNQIKEFFSAYNGIDHLNGIGFVTQSSLARLTPTQQYIFDSILAIFGKDVANNIFMTITFADGQHPPAMDAIEAAKIPYSKFFKFNNSALFAKNEDDENDEDENFDAMFWKMGSKSFKKFFTSFEQAESISLQLTKDVLKERQQLEVFIQGFQPRISAGLSKLEELRQEEKILDQRKAEIEANKDFTYQVPITKQRKISLSRGQYVTNCGACGLTCHFPCSIPIDGEKYNCAAMRNAGSQSAVCNVCGCPWYRHFNNDYRLEDYPATETRTSQDLKERFDKAVTGKNQVESMIANMNSYLEDVAEDVFSMIQQMQQSLARLDQIALKPDPLTQDEHLQLLIDSEKREKKLGWAQRVAYYEEAKQQAQMISKMRSDGKLGDKPKANFKAWVEKFIYW